MDAAAVLQLGNGLNNLHALVLAEKKSNEEWRVGLDRKIDEKFEAVEERLKSVCDEGRSEHDAMRARIGVLELDRKLALERQAGRDQIKATVANGVTWTLKHGFQVLCIAYMVWDALLFPMVQSAVARPTQTLEIRGAL